MPITTAADDTLNFLFCLFFIENELTFYVNHLLGRQFILNVKTYFLWNKKKIRMWSATNFASANQFVYHWGPADKLYRIYHMYLDRHAWANSIDPDKTPQNAASHLGLHCLPLIQQFLDTTSSSELYWFKF